MRPNDIRDLLLAGLVACALPQISSSQERFRSQEYGGERGDSLFSLPRSQEEIHLLDKAREDLQDGDYQGAVERLHRLIQTETGGIVAAGLDRFLGLRLAAVQTLASMSPAAVEAYETLTRREAGPLMRRPPYQLSREQLELLAEGFPTSRAGLAARLRLGNLELERGDGHTAAHHFRAALDASPPGSAEHRAVARRLDAARVASSPRAFRAGPVPGLDMDLADEILTALPHAGGAATGWPAYGGPSGLRSQMDAPAGRPTTEWSHTIQAPGFEYNGGQFAMHAVGDLDAVYVSNGIRVTAFDPLRHKKLWESRAPMAPEGDAGNLYRDMQGYGDAISRDTVLAPAYGDDVVVAVLQVPEDSDNIVYRRAITIVSRIPERRLFGLDRATGKLLWSHWDQLDGPVTRRFRGHTACGPPLVVGDTVYLATHGRTGAIAFYLSAYDLHTGDVRWRRLICSSQQEVNMFGNARKEFAGAPLLAEGGVLYGSTNLGLCFAVDIADGRIRWLNAYEVIPLPMTQLHGQRRRIVYFANNPPAMTNGVVAFTPLDSRHAIGLDAATGRLLWRVAYEARVNGNNDIRWLLGSIDDEFVFAGTGVVAVKARPDAEAGLGARVRQIRRPEILHPGASPMSEDVPRGALADDFIYYPAPGTLSIFDKQGTMAPHSGDIRVQQAGNLLLVDGMLVTLRERQLTFAYDLDGLLRTAEARLQQDADDVAAHYRVATLLRAQVGVAVESSRADAAERAFRRGLAAARRQGMGPGTPMWERLARDLFQLSLDRATAAAQRTPRKALELFRAARERAPDVASWLRAQVAVLEHVGDDAALAAELELMMARHGSAVYTFPDAGRMPVAAYALWRRAEIGGRPADRIADYQTLIERFPDEAVAGERLASLANDRITMLIERHGRGCYRAVESRARAMLEGAAGDPAVFELVARRFPHSEAALSATAGILDLAVRRGDLAAATEAFAHAVTGAESAPGMLRRLMLVAEQRGNAPLARALGDRLLRDHATAASDWAADGGSAYGALLEPSADPVIEVSPPQLPAEIVNIVQPKSPSTPIKPVPLHRIAGFTPAAEVPLYTVVDGVDGGSLEAYDLDGSGGTVAESLFHVPVEYVTQLLLCGSVLVVPDITRVRGLDYRTGQALWELHLEGERFLQCLGAQAGVLHVFATRARGEDGGELMGLEPLTGSLMFHRTLDPRRAATSPRGTGGEIVLVESVEDSDTPTLHRIDPLTGATTHEIELSTALMESLGIDPALDPDTQKFARGVFAEPNRLYLALDSRVLSEAPRLGAIDNDGRLVWAWEGVRGRGLLMHALHDDRVVLVEGGQQAGGRIVVLAKSDGEVLLERDLGDSVHVLNWEVADWQHPCPDAVLVADRTNELRLTCLSLVDSIPSFQVDVPVRQASPIERPVFGADFVAFGLRVDRPGAARRSLRLYALRLDDRRRGALPGGDKYLGLPLGTPYVVQRHGAYTVVKSTDGLLVLGDGSTRR